MPRITLVIDGEQHEDVDLAASLTGLVERMDVAVVAQGGDPEHVTYVLELASAGLLLHDLPEDAPVEALIEAVPNVARERPEQQSPVWVVAAETRGRQ